MKPDFIEILGVLSASEATARETHLRCVEARLTLKRATDALSQHRETMVTVQRHLTQSRQHTA